MAGETALLEGKFGGVRLIIKPTHLSGRVEWLQTAPADKQKLRLTKRLKSDVSQTHGIKLVEPGYWKVQPGL
jgi:hypothetical protein